jgi:hypothetical protein
MHYVLVYNRNTSKTEKIIPEADFHKTFELFKQYQNDEKYDDREIIFVTADNEADLKKYWGRYFTQKS